MLSRRRAPPPRQQGGMPPTKGRPRMASPRKPKASGSKAPAKDYAVGYGKPPKANQFKPNQSGNPRGESRMVRARKADRDSSPFDMTIINESARPVAITENGKRTQISTYQAISRSLMIDAAKGNRSAQKLAIDKVEAAHARQQIAARERFGLLVQYYTSQIATRNGPTPPAPHDAQYWPHPDDVELDYVLCIGEVVGPIDARQAEPFAALIDDYRLWQARLVWLQDMASQWRDDLRYFQDKAANAITELLDRISRFLPPSFKAQLDWATSETPDGALDIEGDNGQIFNLALIEPQGNDMVYCLYQLFNGAGSASDKVGARARLDIAANTTSLVNRLQIERQNRDAGMAPGLAVPEFNEFYEEYAEEDKSAP
ncbi:MAG: DUF5681 domain-containing protein [Sphingobium sp.]